ncbi:MAG: RagB/SusD family nutrient uptake outer membrane protein [Bacteroidales bacterium]|nr:RagB/SusD family nutrient uptake outer membrane protein [Bacteroidales bacterium]
MKTKNIYISISVAKIVIVTVLFSFLLSCEEDEPKPYSNNNNNFIDTIDYNSFNSYDEVLARIRYNYEYITFHWGMYWNFNNILSGQYEIDDWDMELNALEYFGHYAASSTILSIWSGCYQSVSISNLFLSDTQNSSDISINAYKGQVYFYRALSYFTLIKYFGEYYPYEDFNAPGVPILSGDETQPNTRASVQEVYDRIIHDLDSATIFLPDPGVSAENNTTRYSAMALAAKTHIWFGQYYKADVLLEQIIQSGYFYLTDRFSDNFDGQHENNSESLFEFQYYWNGGTRYSSTPYYPAQAYSYMQITNRWNTVAESAVTRLGNDPRAKETYYSPGDTMIDDDGTTVINETYDYYIKKYAHVIKPSGSGSYYGNNLVLIRLSDVYLLHSEAQIMKGNIAESITYINMVKERAGADLITNHSLSADALMEILRDERFNELCGEGSYWFDLIRWDMADSELGDRGFIKGKHEALPIPQIIVDNNPGIDQNAGY